MPFNASITASENELDPSTPIQLPSYKPHRSRSCLVYSRRPHSPIGNFSPRKAGGEGINQGLPGLALLESTSLSVVSTQFYYRDAMRNPAANAIPSKTTTPTIRRVTFWVVSTIWSSP
jgi:hypothetical protein